MPKLADKHFNAGNPKYSNRTWQQAFFNAPKNLSREQREKLADTAYAKEKEKNDRIRRK